MKTSCSVRKKLIDYSGVRTINVFYTRYNMSLLNPLSTTGLLTPFVIGSYHEAITNGVRRPVVLRGLSNDILYLV